jgi:hypothetical protein
VNSADGEDESRCNDVAVTGAILAYVASAILIAWGTAHLAPTRAVAGSFGDISLDNRRILVMEWVAEGIAHISIGVLVILTTAIDGASDSTTQLVYCVCAATLVVLATLTALTGSRTAVIWFRICPFVLTGSAVLLVLAALV